MRGINSCCTVSPHCQSFSRTPQPFSVSGLTCVSVAEVPLKLRSLPVSALHTSGELFAPATVGPCAAKLSRLQSTTLLLLLSVQPRDTVLMIRFAGLLRVYALSFVAA